MRKIILVLALVLTFTAGWAADNNKKNIPLGDPTYKEYCDSLTQLGDEQFFVKGDFDKALSYYNRACTAGGVDAAFMLGRMYAEGLVFDVDYDRAFRLWAAAAAAGHADSAYKIGETLLLGGAAHESILPDGTTVRAYGGMKPDKTRGVEWMERADSLGSIEATYLLGVLYKNALFVEADEDKALEYWTRAADKGYAKAQEALGLEYLDGKNTKRNMLFAVKYLKMAADQGMPKAAYYAGLCCEKAYGLPNEDMVSAAYYYMVAADAEIPEAQYRLALLYTDGNGVDQNLDRATYWLQQAQKNGLKVE